VNVIKRRSVRPALIGRGMAALAVLGLALTGCTGTGPAKATAKPKGLKAAGVSGTVTYWTTTGNINKVVAIYEKSHPSVKVDIINLSGSNLETKLEDAIKARSGIPDVMEMNYADIEQFAIAKQLTNLNAYGAQKVKPDFTPGAWSEVAVDGGVYGMPRGVNPVMLFYRSDVFSHLGLKPPATWAQFAADAEKIHAADSSRYITFFSPTDVNGALENIWQAGGRPFKSKGSSLYINLTDAGSTRWADLWSSLIRKHLVVVEPDFTSQWDQQLADGDIVAWINPSWAPTTLLSVAPKEAGKWRVAAIPQWNPTGKTYAEDGSGLVVPAGAPNKAAAANFAEWMGANPTANLAMYKYTYAFPGTKSTLSSKSFLDLKDSYLGGQSNTVIAGALRHVSAGFQFPPYDAEAATLYADTVGKAAGDGGNLLVGLKAWQSRLAAYGRLQGFSVQVGG